MAMSWYERGMSIFALVPDSTVTEYFDGYAYSGAIVEYLIQTHGKGRFVPPNRQGQLDNTFFLHFAEGSFMPPLVLKLVFSALREQAPFFVRPFISIVANQISSSFIDPILQTNFDMVHKCLARDGGRDYLAGGKEPTGGDFMVRCDSIRSIVLTKANIRK